MQGGDADGCGGWAMVMADYEEVPDLDELDGDGGL